MIKRATLLASNHLAISALLMYGSFVKNEGDVFSDIEFYVFLNPGDEFDSQDWVNQIAPVSTFFCE